VVVESPSGPASPAGPGARTATLALAGWALAVPFFLLPGPLTVEAPDIYGGFGLHLRLGALLAGVGLALGAARLYLVPRRELPPALDRTLSVLLLLALAALVSWAGQRTLSPAFLGPGWPDEPARPDLPIAVAGAALLIRAGLDRREGAGVRLLACAGLLWVVPVAAAALAGPGRLPSWPGWLLLGLVGALLVAWPALARTGRPWLVGWRIAATLPFALAGLHAGRVACPGGWSWPGGLLGALLLAALGLQLLARVDGPIDDGPRWRLPWRALTAGLLLLAALAATDDLLDRAISLAESWAFLLEPVRGALHGADAPRELPAWVGRLWLLAFVAGALHAGSARAVRGWIGGCALLWSLLALARLASLGGGQAWPVLLGLAAIPLALAWPALLDRETRLDLTWAAPLAGALIGPVALRYLLSATMRSPPGAAVLVPLGLVLGAALLLPLALDRRTLPVSPAALAGGLVVAGVLGVMPVYAAVALGLAPGLVLTLALASAAVAALAWRRVGWLAPLLALWLAWYGCTAAMTAFKAGPSADDCARALADSPARVLLDRFGEGGAYSDAQPYDVLPLPAHGALLATFKRIRREHGFVELLDLEQPARRSRLVTARPGETPSWPERMEYDPIRDGVITQILGREDYALWDLRVDEGELWLAFDLPIEWEPGNPALDVERRRMTVSFVPNRPGRNPLARVYDLDSLRPVATLTRTGGRLEMADFAAVDPASGRSWIPAWYDASRFVLVGFDADGRVHRQTETAAPGIGLAIEGERLFVTRSLSGGLAVRDLETLELLEVLPAGRFPRDLVLDRRRQRLYVGGYADGVVRAWSTAGQRLEPLFDVPVGPLLRGLGLDPESGRVYAASGCGLFEVAGPGGAAP